LKIVQSFDQKEDQSFGDPKGASKNFIPLLEQKLNTKLLNELAPLSIRLKNGRQTKVHYEEGRPPWISSRLQDFFGMQDTPQIGSNKTALLIHLLAPRYSGHLCRWIIC